MVVVRQMCDQFSNPDYYWNRIGVRKPESNIGNTGGEPFFTMQSPNWDTGKLATEGGTGRDGGELVHSPPPAPQLFEVQPASSHLTNPIPAASVNTKNQITMPADIRKAMDLSAHDRVVFTILDDGTIVMQAKNRLPPLPSQPLTT